MRTFAYRLFFVFFMVSCKESKNDNLIKETWKLTVTETEPLRFSFHQQNKILNEIYGNISEYNTELNRSKFDSVKILRSNIIKESNRCLTQLKKQSQTEQNVKIISATINLLNSLIEVKSALPIVYDKVEMNIDNKFAPRHDEFLEILTRYKKIGGEYDKVKDNYYKVHKVTIETSI